MAIRDFGCLRFGPEIDDKHILQNGSNEFAKSLVLRMFQVELIGNCFLRARPY